MLDGVDKRINRDIQQTKEQRPVPETSPHNDRYRLAACQYKKRMRFSDQIECHFFLNISILKANHASMSDFL